METTLRNHPVIRKQFTFANPNYRSIFGNQAASSPFLGKNPTVSVIIPTLNEAENLPFVLPRIPTWVDEVLLVDGRSTDKTIEVARALRPDIRVVLEHKPGKGAALRCGLEAASGDIVVLIDADGSNDPTEIHGFVGALLSGADFAKGTRFIQGAGSDDISLLRWFGNMSFTSIVRVFFGGAYTDLCYGYNAFWRKELYRLALDGDGFEIETIMNIRALRKGLRVAEVPSFEHPRIHGSSNLNTFRDGWRVLKAIFREAFLELEERLMDRATGTAGMIPNTSGGSTKPVVMNQIQGD